MAEKHEVMLASYAYRLITYNSLVALYVGTIQTSCQQPAAITGPSVIVDLATCIMKLARGVVSRWS